MNEHSTSHPDVQKSLCSKKTCLSCTMPFWGKLNLNTACKLPLETDHWGTILSCRRPSVSHLIPANVNFYPATLFDSSHVCLSTFPTSSPPFSAVPLVSKCLEQWTVQVSALPPHPRLCATAALNHLSWGNDIQASGEMGPPFRIKDTSWHLPYLC